MEALYKLLKISGGLETLLLRGSNVIPLISEDFVISLGENKTMKYLDLSFKEKKVPAEKLVRLGTAIAMNARRGCSLEVVLLENWYLKDKVLDKFLENMFISEKDHELWYGDKKKA